MRHPILQHPAIQQYSERHTWCRAMRWHSSLDEKLVAQLWDGPAQLIEASLPLQDKERCLVARLETKTGPLVLKRQNWGGAWKTFCKSLRTPQARQSFLDGLHLSEQGVWTPRPLALVERKWGPLGGHSYLLTEFITGTSLYRLIRFDNPPRQFVLHLADQVAKLCQRLSELCISHNDLKPENLMVDPTGRVWLIDLEKMRLHDKREPVRERLLEDLNRLLHPRSWRENLSAAEVFRTRLLEQPAVAAAVAQVKPKQHPLLHPELIAQGQDNKLSVLVTGCYKAHDLSASVESIRDIADEIVVASSCASDAIRTSAKAIGAKIVERDYETPLAFRNRALTSVSHPWVLWMEAGERVSPDLAKEIQCLLSAEPTGEGYCLPRRRLYLGHICKYGRARNEAALRLFRRDKGLFAMAGRRPQVELQTANVARMNAKLIDRCTASVEDLVRSMNETSSRAALTQFVQGRKPKLFRAAFRAASKFAQNYFVRLAMLDGRVGFQVSLLSAISIWLTEVKLWELKFSKVRQPEHGQVTDGKDQRQAA
jgi:hypothetical protein